jgi:MYXO-CTERM domain-containing protein
MSRKLRFWLGPCAALVAFAAAAPAAAADGLPVPFDGSTNTGVPSLDGGFRYSAISAGASTTVLRIATGTGEIQRSLRVRGDFAVPLVAYDATPSGLSANGRTLALIEPRRRFPRTSTTFALLDAERLRLRDRLTLEGDFSFDALSPDGRTMYLIHYPQPRDPTAYEVRAYDLERGRLLPKPIIDPNESGEEMAGWPQTRALSPDGRWAYTLYLPAERDHPPFIHALDTERGTAVCIDLDSLAKYRNFVGLALQPSPDGSTLTVAKRDRALADVELGSFEVSEPAPPGSVDDEGDALPWALIAGGAALLIAAGVLAVRRRRPGRPDEHELERLVELGRGGREEKDAREREPVA